MHVDRQGSISSRFLFSCHGGAKYTQLLMESGKVNMPVRDVCKGGQIRVSYNNKPGWFQVDMKDNKMVEYDGSQNHISFPQEILSSFLIEHQLSPAFLYNHEVHFDVLLF